MEPLTAAFAALRKQGFIARQRFSCCSGCAGSELATYVGEMPAAKRAKVRGVVFYTRQDFANKSKFLHIKYGPVDSAKVGKVGLPTVEVGQAVFEALRAAGLNPEWDGSPDKTIIVEA